MFQTLAPIIMRPYSPALCLLLAAAPHHLSAQVPEWAWARSGVGLEYDEAITVATDPLGNVIVAGNFTSGSITFGDIILQNNTPGDDDLYVVKYDPEGNVTWARSAGGALDDKADAVTTDAAGNVYLAGNFYSPTISFGDIPLTNAGNVGDVCLVKYDPAGTVLWATRGGGAGLEIPHAIAVDPGNNVIVAGRFSSNEAIFGSTTLLQAGSMDVFVVKYDANGNVLWATGAGGGSNDEAQAVAVDAAGDIIVAGYYTQEADFGTTTLPNPGLANIFLAKCDGVDGTFLWAESTAADGDERALAIDLDAQDNIFVAGFFASDELTFGSTTLINSGINNGFVARYNNVGEAQWAQGLNGRSKVQGIALANDAVYACGFFNDSPLNYGPDELTVQGGSDLFVLKSDLAGNAQWVAKQGSGGESGESAMAIAADAGGHLVIAGRFDSDEVTFGSAQLTISDGFDMFVLRMGDPDVGIVDAAGMGPVSLYPNPGAGPFVLEGLTGVRTIEISNSMGAVVLTQRIPAAQERIMVDLDGLPAGHYQLTASGEGRTVVTKLVLLGGVGR